MWDPQYKRNVNIIYIYLKSNIILKVLFIYQNLDSYKWIYFILK